MLLSSDFRRNAREALRGKWMYALGVGLVAAVLGGTTMPSIGFSNNVNINTNGNAPSTDNNTFFPEIDPSTAGIILIVLGVVLVFALVISIVYFFVGSCVEVGYAKFNLNLIDKQDAVAGNLFLYFRHWKNVVCTNFLKTLYTFLWALLFLVPGIIAMYNYAMTAYIMAEYPETSASNALAISKKMMYGNRMRLFRLELSFIGWSILCVIGFGIGFLWLNPYKKAAITDFYREISGTRPVEFTVNEEFDYQN